MPGELGVRRVGGAIGGVPGVKQRERVFLPGIGKYMAFIYPCIYVTYAIYNLIL
jgi:hypothetical protein